MHAMYQTADCLHYPSAAVCFDRLHLFTYTEYLIAGAAHLRDRICYTYQSEKETSLMAEKDDYLELLPLIQALPDEETITPTMPVDTAKKEAELLQRWLQADLPKFKAAQFDMALIDGLQKRINALNFAEVNWCYSRKMRADAQVEWTNLRPELIKLRSDLFAALEYVFDEKTDLQAVLSDIREGTSNADLVMDFSKLNDLCVRYRELLDAIGFPQEKLQRLAELSSTLGSLLGAADADRLTNSAERIIRDKAYTYLKNAVDKIRRCGKYVSRDDDDRQVGYRSEYRTKKYQKTAAAETAPATSAVK